MMSETVSPKPVARAHPRDHFTPEEWARLRGVSSWKGLALVAHAWGVIGLALWASFAFPNPIVWLLAVMVIGTRQLGLAILRPYMLDFSNLMPVSLVVTHH